MSPPVSTETPSQIADGLTKLAQQSGKPAYLVVYASLTDGRSWCGDCRDAEPFVNKKFEGRDADVKIVYAGQKDEWRKHDNPFRQAPFNVVALPTVIKVTGEKWEQLVEADVYDQAKLDAFVD